MLCRVEVTSLRFRTVATLCKIRKSYPSSEKSLFIFIGKDAWPACVPHVLLGHTEVRGGHQKPWNFSYEWL